MVLKSLQELNTIFIGKTQTYEHIANERSVNEPRADESSANKPRAKTLLPAKEKALMAVMALLLLLALLFGAVAGGEKNSFRYSFFTVLSQSMYDEIPKGSLIVVRKTDPQLLRVGDNITFKRNRTTTVTHKVIEIHENYNDSGVRGFKTMGINNADPDTGIVYANSVIGVVSCCIPGLGFVLAYISDNIWIMCVLLVGTTAAMVFEKEKKHVPDR